MAIVEFHGGTITHRYLMNKSKHDLARMYMELLRVREDEAKAVKAVVDELCAHEGAEGFSDGTHDRVDALYARLGLV